MPLYLTPSVASQVVIKETCPPAAAALAVRPVALVAVAVEEAEEAVARHDAAVQVVDAIIERVELAILRPRILSSPSSLPTLRVKTCTCAICSCDTSADASLVSDLVDAVAALRLEVRGLRDQRAPAAGAVTPQPPPPPSRRETHQPRTTQTLTTARSHNKHDRHRIHIRHI